MSLIRQVWLLLILTLAVAFFGTVGVSLRSAHQYLETQIGLKNSDTAQSLALPLSQQGGDPTAIELMISSQFDTGAYVRIELFTPEGKSLVARRAKPRTGIAPAWFVKRLDITPDPGIAQVSDGWKQFGRLEVVSQVDYAYDELWRATRTSASLIGLLALITGVIAALGVKHITKPLKAVVDQAAALSERRFIPISEPSVPELRGVAHAMNTMVSRLKTVFGEQTREMDQLRFVLNCDPLTGLSNRTHFMSRLKAVLGSEDGVESGALLMMRIKNLQHLNHTLGREATDSFLHDVGVALMGLAAGTGSTDVGRLNGSEFAAIIYNPGPLPVLAQEAMDRIAGLTQIRELESVFVIGVVGWHHADDMSTVLSAGDHALASADASHGIFTTERTLPQQLPRGEDAWRAGLDSAIEEKRLKFAEVPVIDEKLSQIHHECPLRIQLAPNADWLPAAHWYPMAHRLNKLGTLDIHAVRLALTAINQDNHARAIILSTDSLLEVSLIGELRQLLKSHQSAARSLWLEVTQTGALQNPSALRELALLAQSFGVKLGLMHVTTSFTDIEALMGLGLDFAKLDASFVEGVSADSVRQQHVTGTVRMLHGLGLRVFAEGVHEVDDAKALWNCGIDGLSGAVVQQLTTR